MKNEITKVFNGSNVEIIIGEKEELLFELYSTGMALGQVKKNTAGAVYPRRDRIDENIKNAEITPCVHNGHTYITEEQLYDLMLEMKTDKVKPFRKWITSEVLPTIRKTGSYSIQQKPDSYMIDDPVERANRWIEEYQEKKALEVKIEEQKPKVEYCEKVLNKDGLITTTMIAKDLGLTSAKKLNEILNANRIIYKQSNSWHPYADYDWLITEGYADYQSYDVDKSNPILKWTEKGRQWIVGNYETWLENAEFED